MTRNIYSERNIDVMWAVLTPCPHNEVAVADTATWCETCGDVLWEADPAGTVRIALRNNFGGVTRAVELPVSDVGSAWDYMYDTAHREAYPATRDSVQVRMADGSWCNGTILR